MLEEPDSPPPQLIFPPGVTVTVKRDYYGYFEEWLCRTLWEKYKSMPTSKLMKSRYIFDNFSHFYVDASPYVGHDIEWHENEEDGGLYITFYAGLHRRGGPEVPDDFLDILCVK